MQGYTATEKGHRSVVRLETEKTAQGFKQTFPNPEMARVDYFIYGFSSCKCGNGVILLPFWDGVKYELYAVCMKCGETKRKGGGK